jgi:hypothetical protein
MKTNDPISQVRSGVFVYQKLLVCIGWSSGRSILFGGKGNAMKKTLFFILTILLILGTSSIALSLGGGGHSGGHRGGTFFKPLFSP